MTASMQIHQSLLTHIGQALPEMTCSFTYITIYMHMCFSSCVYIVRIERKTHKRHSTGRLSINSEASSEL